MGQLTVIGSTGQGVELPVLIARAGDRAARRFLEFFTVNIRNRNTRAAYARAAAAFLRWCEGQGIGRTRARPAGACGGVHRTVAEQAVAAHGQAASRLYPHAVRLAGDRASDAVESGALRPGAASFGEQGRQRRCCPPRKQPRC